MTVSNITYKSDTFQGAYFICNPNQSDESFALDDKLLITDHRLQLKKYIIKKIQEAKHSVKLCSFILTDEEIVVELCKAISQRHIAVFVLTQLDDSKFTTSYLSEEEVEQIKKSSENIHRALIKQVYESGGHIRAAENLHAKFLIIDRQEVLITSANITTPSLNLNTELGYVSSIAEDVKEYDKLFDLVYQHGTQYEKFIRTGKGSQFIIKSNTSINPEWFPKDDSSSLKYTFEKESNSLYEQIISIINNSHRKVVIFTYSIVELNAIPKFMDAIKDALVREVEIKIFCRGMNYRTDHLKATEILHNLGCEVFGDLHNHAKGIINEGEGFIFTANIDGKHGLINGFEIGCKLNAEGLEALRKFFNHKLKTAPLMFKKHPQKTELVNTWNEYYSKKGIFNPFLHKDYELVLKRNNQIGASLKKHPIFIKTDKSKRALELECDHHTYSIVKQIDGQLYIDDSHTIKSNCRVKFFLPYKNLKISEE